MPVINKSEATKKLRDQKENGKCTNSTNRRSRVGLSTPFFTPTKCRLQMCRDFCLLAFCLAASGKWKNFTGSLFGFLFHDSGYGESFLQVPKAHLLVVTILTELLIELMWLTRMSELFRFVYIRSHVTLHVKSNAERVNSAS